jgi:hypothetical protein
MWEPSGLTTLITVGLRLFEFNQKWSALGDAIKAGRTFNRAELNYEVPADIPLLKETQDGP